MGKRFWQIFPFSLLAGVLTALAFTMSYGCEFDFLALLILPDVTILSCVVGILLGALLSLWAYFCLWDKYLLITLPLLYVFAFWATVLLNLIAPRIKLDFLGFYGACFFWILALLLGKFLAPKLKENKL
jgi:hypothetical protein